MLRTVCGVILITLLLVASGCFNFPFRRELRQARHISNLTLDGNYLYFGGGYHLYRLDLSTQSIETIFTPDRILVEQPIVNGGVAYFGGSSYVNEKMSRGEVQGFFAVDSQTRQLQWKFPLGIRG